MWRWALWLVVLLVWGGAAPVYASSQTDEEAALADAKRSVVRVTVLKRTDEGVSLSYGSGFVVSPGVIVTNYHVVESALGEGGMSPNAVILVTPTLGEGKEALPGIVRWTWPAPDLAMINVEGLTSPPLPLTSQVPGLTDRVRAAGYPGKTEQMLRLTPADIISPRTPYATVGSIALLSDRSVGGDAIATIFHGATISRGNSGGPLLDACGRLIGVNTWAGTAEVDSDGVVASSGDQNVATRVDSLFSFLDQTKTPSTRDDEVCALGKAQAVVDQQTKDQLKHLEQELAAAQASAKAEQARIREEDARNAAAMRRWLLLGGLAIAALVLGLGLLRLRQRKALPTISVPPAPVTPPQEVKEDVSPETPIAAPPPALARRSKPNWVVVALLVIGVVVLGLVVSATLTWS